MAKNGGNPQLTTTVSPTGWKMTLDEPSDPVSWWKCQLLLRCVEGRVPRTSMCNGNLPFYCRHVEPSYERVQDKCQTSHHIKCFKNHLKCCYCATTQKKYIGKLCYKEKTHTQGKTNGKSWSLVQLPGFSWTRVACLTAWNWSNKASIRWRRASKGVRQSLLTISGMQHQCDEMAVI